MPSLSLWEASKNGQVATVTFLLDLAGADVNAKDESGTTALRLAASFCRIQVLEILIQHNVDLDVQNNYGSTALMLSSSKGYVDVVKLLLTEGADVSIKDEDGWTAFMHATYNGKMDCALLLLKSKADPYTTNEEGKSALDIAKDHGYFNALQKLIEDASSLNETSNKIPEKSWMRVQLENHDLIEAGKRGDVLRIRYLMKKGVNVNMKDGELTGLIAACRCGKREAVIEFLKWGADIDSFHGNGWTALMEASHGGNDQVVKVLLEASAKVNTQSGNGSTALMKACSFRGNLNCVKLLVEYGADLSIVDGEGRTAKDIAREERKMDIVRFLEEIDSHNGDNNSLYGSVSSTLEGTVVLWESVNEALQEENQCLKNGIVALRERDKYNQSEMQRLKRELLLQVRRQEDLRMERDRREEVRRLEEERIEELKTEIVVLRERDKFNQSVIQRLRNDLMCQDMTFAHRRQEDLRIEQERRDRRLEQERRDEERWERIHEAIIANTADLLEHRKRRRT